MTITVAYLTADQGRGSPKVRRRKGSERWSGYFWHQGKMYERTLVASDKAAALKEIASIRSFIVLGKAAQGDHEAVLRFTPLVPTATPGVYAVRDRLGYIKIGKAKNIKARLVQLQSGNAHRIELVAVLSRRLESERWFHRLLKNTAWVDGEWFAPTPRVLEVISQGRARF